MGDNSPLWLTITAPGACIKGSESVSEEYMVTHGLVALADYAWDHRLNPVLLYDVAKEAKIQSQSGGYPEDKLREAIQNFYQHGLIRQDQFKAATSLTHDMLPRWEADTGNSRIRIGNRPYYRRAWVGQARAWVCEHYRQKQILAEITKTLRKEASKKNKKARRKGPTDIVLGKQEKEIKTRDFSYF